MKILVVLLATLVIFSSFTSCTKTVTETKYDTTIVQVHDTLNRAAMIRFVSLIPDNIPNSNLIYIKTDPNQTTSTMVARDHVSGSYYAVPPDAPVVYYVSVDGHDQIMPLPSLERGALYTFALTYADSSFDFPYTIDSEKLHAIPQNYCRIRLMHAIPDGSPNPLLYLTLDDLRDTLFKSGIQSRDITPYLLIPSGSHTVSVRVVGDISGPPLWTSPSSIIFQDGGYYTVRGRGENAHHNIKFDCDQE
jgi:hypothetical protein